MIGLFWGDFGALVGRGGWGVGGVGVEWRGKRGARERR